MPQWTIITVTYNSARDLESYWDGNLPPDVEWIVVDNGSSDDSVGAARRAGATKVVPLHANHGFGLANNIGFAIGSGDYIAFVNPDVRVDFESLAALSESINQAGGIVGPQLLNPDGTLQPNGRGFPTLRNKILNRLGSQTAGYFIFADPRSRRYVCWLIGAAVAAKREIFADLRAWDEHFFIYYEDSDLCLRAWAAGIPVEIDGSVRWVHGWARATTKLRIKPWIREFASARKFYRRYPYLLWAERVAARKYQHIHERMAQDTRIVELPASTATHRGSSDAHRH